MNPLRAEKPGLSRRGLLKAPAGAFLFSRAATARPAASERVAVAFIGVGIRGGSGLVKNFLRVPAAQCVAVCDCFRERREKIAAEIDAAYTRAGTGTSRTCTAYNDFREMLQRKDIDAVVIATPDHWHVPALIRAARAGKHIYCEKPLSYSFALDLTARKVIRETGRVFQYGTQQRGSAHVRFGCELVRSGRIGKVTAVEVFAPAGKAGGATAEQPVPPGFDYELWTGPAPTRPYNDDRCLRPGHYFIYDYCIGFLGGWGAHPLDVMDWGFAEPLVPAEVEGTGNIPSEGLYNTVMNWDVRCRFTNGVNLVFRDGPDSTRFTGTDGSITIRRSALSAEPSSLIAGFRGAIAPGEVPHAQNFVDAVRGNSTPESPIDSAVRSDLLSHLSDIAIRTGRNVRWDSRAETIAGDSEAAGMLKRNLREPYGV